MFELNPLFQSTNSFVPFPAANDVFGTDVELHRKYLLPLASVDLASISPKMKGWAHFVHPYESTTRLPGSPPKSFDNYYCRPNWIAYRYSRNKCTLDCPFDYFELYRLSQMKRRTGKNANRFDALTHEYGKIETGFNLRKSHFETHGCLHNPWARKRHGAYKDSHRYELVWLGGPSLADNWSCGFPLKLGRHTDRDGETWETALPLTEDGRPFTFVGSLPAYHYIAETPEYLLLCDTLKLFYDPKSRIALTTFNWT